MDTPTHANTVFWGGAGSENNRTGKARFMKVFLYASRGVAMTTLISSIVAWRIYQVVNTIHQITA